MIPSLILAGLIVGMFPRPWYWFGLGLAVILWLLLLAVTGTAARSLESFLAALLLAAAKTGVAVIVARLLVHWALAISERLRR